MEPANKKAVVETFDIAMVFGIFLAFGRSSVGSILIPRTFRTFVSVSICHDKPENIYLVGKYKQIAIDAIDNADVCDNNPQRHQ